MLGHHRRLRDRDLMPFAVKLDEDSFRDPIKPWRVIFRAHLANASRSSAFTELRQRLVIPAFLHLGVLGTGFDK